MSAAMIEIRVDGAGPGEIAQHFTPGAVVQGSVQITPEGDLNCRHVFARLQWRTEGRGDEDKAIAAEQDLFQGLLPGGLARHYSFNLRLPDRPWSYAGQLVRIVWEVEVSIDVAFARDPSSSAAIVMRPGEV